MSAPINDSRFRTEITVRPNNFPSPDEGAWMWFIEDVTFPGNPDVVAFGFADTEEDAQAEAERIDSNTEK